MQLFAKLNSSTVDVPSRRGSCINRVQWVTMTTSNRIGVMYSGTRLSNDEDDGSKKSLLTMDSRCFEIHHSSSMSFNLSNIGEFFSGVDF